MPVGRLKHVPLKRELFTVSVVAVVLVGALAAAGYFYMQYQDAQKNFSVGTAQTGEEEVRLTVEKVSKLMELPSGETPTLATVSDLTKLQGQEFFARAQNGDKVLIYEGAKKAILYRPSTNKIIEVAPVNFPSPSVSQSQTATDSSALVSPTPSEVRVALYNGTNVTGLTRTVERDLTGTFSAVEVVARENAGSNGYDTTLVVDLSGKNAQFAEQIAEEIGGTVVTLPADEEKPSEESDILIIVGSDYTD